MAEYITKQRIQIIECLKKHKNEHLTVDGLVAHLAQEGEHVGRTTVYRTLDKLCREGMLRRYELSGESCACYQYIDNDEGCTEHFHLKCESCGELIHLGCHRLGELSGHIEAEHAFKVNNAKTVLYGTCAKCCAAQNTQKTTSKENR